MEVADAATLKRAEAGPAPFQRSTDWFIQFTSDLKHL